MKALRKIIALTLYLFVCVSAYAQGGFDIRDSIITVKEKNKLEWGMSFTMVTTKVFRGVIPSPGMTAYGQGGIMKNGFYFGFYGGVGFTPETNQNPGQYQETDMLIGYTSPSFGVSLQSYWNFTEGITDMPEPAGFFDWGKNTRTLTDLILNYRFGRKKKFQLLSATFIPPTRDVDLIPQGAETVRGKARYSQYLELQYSTKVAKNDKLKMRIGGSWRWTEVSEGAEKRNFYVTNNVAGIHNIGIDYIRNIKIGDQTKLPVKAMVTYNPDVDRLYFVFGIELIPLTMH